MSEAKGNRPVYLAKCKQNPKSDFFMVIGAAFKFKEGDGLVLRLDAIPTQWDGSMILVPPKEDE
jgi:hypothetical protein